MSEEQEQFNQAFGEQHTGISEDCRYDMNCIKNNQPNVNELNMRLSDTSYFTDLSWRLLGRYIANNNQLEKVDLLCCGITDEIMALLFRELTYSTSLNHLDLSGNSSFGIEGIRSMILFLQNSPNLSSIGFNGHKNFNSECFTVLIQALQNTRVWRLEFHDCNITNISALELYALPYLNVITFHGNNIGREGCRTLANILQKKDTRLSYLFLDNTGIDDEGAEIIANSLKHNTKLKTLHLVDNNQIIEKGFKVFLKLLVDVSSVESTYNSNHTLNELWVPKTSMGSYINAALHMNKTNTNSEATGRAKVIRYQLNSQIRKKLCHLQGIEYTSIGSLFADIEPKLLPDILALIGENHGQCELYTTLIQMVPDLLSCIDRNSMIKYEMARNSLQMVELTHQLAALSDKNDLLSKMLD